MVAPKHHEFSRTRTLIYWHSIIIRTHNLENVKLPDRVFRKLSATLTPSIIIWLRGKDRKKECHQKIQKLPGTKRKCKFKKNSMIQQTILRDWHSQTNIAPVLDLKFPLENLLLRIGRKNLQEDHAGEDPHITHVLAPKLSHYIKDFPLTLVILYGNHLQLLIKPVIWSLSPLRYR